MGVGPLTDEMCSAFWFADVDAYWAATVLMLA